MTDLDKVISQFRPGRPMTKGDIETLTGINQEDAEHLLSELAEKDMLKAEQVGRHGKIYELTPRVAMILESRQVRAKSRKTNGVGVANKSTVADHGNERQERLMKGVTLSFRTGREIMDAAGIPEDDAVRKRYQQVLGGLVRQGKIERLQSGKGNLYRRVL